MPRTFAFLRAINVGGRTVPMAQLKAFFEGLGLESVETFIASGNVVFDASTETGGPLQRRIEGHLRESLGYEVVTFLRTSRELAALVKGCPFDAEEVAAAEALNVALLHAPLSEEAQSRLQTLETEVDAFRTSGREVWWLCRVRQSDSAFSNAVFERTVKAKATFRGFNTLQRLAAKYLKA
ncbi:MAG: DUF1697 domain-containing protein [Geothrix sp.]|uniref:DUF1697 domain-containing protein n=1 Tax=Geothrix sp. TaxID=1962974 RepID=UPI003BB0FB62